MLRPTDSSGGRNHIDTCHKRENKQYYVHIYANPIAILFLTGRNCDSDICHNNKNINLFTDLIHRLVVHYEIKCSRYARVVASKGRASESVNVQPTRSGCGWGCSADGAASRRTSCVWCLQTRLSAPPRTYPRRCRSSAAPAQTGQTVVYPPRIVDPQTPHGKRLTVGHWRTIQLNAIGFKKCYITCLDNVQTCGAAYYIEQSTRGASFRCRYWLGWNFIGTLGLSMNFTSENVKSTQQSLFVKC